MAKHSNQGNCVKTAFQNAGIDAGNLPDHTIDGRAMSAIANHYGLQYYDDGTVGLDSGEPVIAIYKTGVGDDGILNGHAEYCPRADAIPQTWNIVGLVAGFKKK